MKIKIVKDIPVEEKVKPKINEIYEVVDIRLPRKGRGNRKLYYIMVNNEMVGVFDYECEVMEDGKDKV